ncbi:MAG: ornithine carbamoyltransferase [Nocardioides sp.]
MTSKQTTRHFLADDDLTPVEQAELIQLALAFKADPFGPKPLAGPKTVATVYDRPTLRTQVSFAAGIAELGGHPMNVDGGLAAMGKRESVEDVARVLGRQASAIVWRTAHQSDLVTMATYSGVPVVNALTDEFHPCQLVADLLTITEAKGTTRDVKVTFIGDGACNMGNSWALAGALAGMHVTFGVPSDYEPDARVIAKASAIGASTGGTVAVDHDPVKAIAGADVVVTDTWVSMGRESQTSERLRIFSPFAVTEELFAHASADAGFLHCLPAYRGKEVAAEVIDGPRSLVWDEAENRRHAQKAILAFLLDGSRR